MDFSSSEITILNVEKAGSNNCLDIMRKIGTKCAVTDFAILLGAFVSHDNHVDYDNSLKGRTSWWYLQDKDRDVTTFIVTQIGTLGTNPAAKRTGGIRPVIPFSGPLPLNSKTNRDSSDILSITYGEYPQYAVDINTEIELSNLFDKGLLKCTGKTYTTDSSLEFGSYVSIFNPISYSEYEYKGRRFVRVKNYHLDDVELSTGYLYSPGKYSWVEVSPLTWYVDEKNKLLISEKLIASGIRNSFYNGYSTTFQKTEMHMFLNDYFKKDIVPTTKINYKENLNSDVVMKTKSIKKSNPYGLNFKNVTEEEIIKDAIESGVPVFLHGRSSEGKSARVKQIDKDCTIIYLRNATPESLNGKSVYNSETGTMIDIKPTWLQKLEERCKNEPDKNHIVFFDEITNALPSIQGIAFNIVLDKEVNGIWKLPENARIVAAGNDMNDSLAANKLAEPLFNRFAHVYIETSVDSWLKWASENNIHPAIYSYIAYKKDKALRSEYNGETPNADPRKWEMASKVLYQTGNIKSLRSLVGKEITDEFVAFCNQSVITLEDVLNNNYTDYDLEMNVGEKYATIIGLTQVDEENYSIVREFVSKLGNEFVSIFDSMWMRNDEERMEIVKEARIISEKKR